jgi:hypothetical protein
MAFANANKVYRKSGGSPNDRFLQALKTVRDVSPQPGVKTADLSTTLRSGRDDKFVCTRRIVISIGA